ncbi:4-hydroxybenzoate octaprenyltransferase [soil metagenome]
MPEASDDAVLPDAARGNWVDARAPKRLRPWLKLGRFDRPAGIWLLMLPAWQGAALAGAEAGRLPRLWIIVATAIGAALMRAAGCAYNDIVDRDIDRKVARTAARPVASGAISRKGAWAFVVGCSLVSLCVLLTLGPLAIGLGVASCALVAAYPFMKRITWWPQAWLGLTFNWGALLAYAAQTAWFCAGRIDAADGLLYASGLFWTLGYDTIYALQDLEDDALAGVKSSARRLGSGVRRGVGLFYAASAALSFAAGWVGHLGVGFFGVWCALAVHLAWQANSVRADRPQLALRLFKSNRDAGIILFVALLFGAWAGA